MVADVVAAVVDAVVKMYNAANVLVSQTRQPEPIEQCDECGECGV